VPSRRESFQGTLFHRREPFRLAPSTLTAASSTFCTPRA
jgi:hypothetical protein